MIKLAWYFALASITPPQTLSGIETYLAVMTTILVTASHPPKPSQGLKPLNDEFNGTALNGITPLQTLSGIETCKELLPMM